SAPVSQIYSRYLRDALPIYRINDPSVANKGLTGEVVLAEAIQRFQEATGTDPRAVDPNSRLGQLFQAQMASIREVVDEAQEIINRPDLGFKGFVPAEIGRASGT